MVFAVHKRVDWGLSSGGGHQTPAVRTERRLRLPPGGGSVRRWQRRASGVA